MIVKGVQQFMLGSVLKNEKKARAVLSSMKEHGYTGIELCDFMINPSSFLIRMLTRLATMPVGKSGKLDWLSLLKEYGLTTIALHTNLNRLEQDVSVPCKEAKKYGTDKLVITGMYRFDYSSLTEVKSLCERLNKAGESCLNNGISLLYHNHNCELRKLSDGQRAYDYIIENTDPRFVNFEFDSYWFTEGGGDAFSYMGKLGKRMVLWHINDRGNRQEGPLMTPIVKTGSMELGRGNMNLDKMVDIAKANLIKAVILETHNNWVDKSPLKSLEVSSVYLNSRF